MFRTGAAISVSLALLALLPPSRAAAQNGERSGFSFGVSLGTNVVPSADGAGTTFKVTPGYEVIDGVDVEFETGFRSARANGVEFGMWPILLGVRFSTTSLPFVPFAGVHFGPGFSATNEDGWWSDGTMFGVSVGGGVDYAIATNFGIGTELTYSYFVPTDGFDAPDRHFVDLTLEIRLGF